MEITSSSLSFTSLTTTITLIHLLLLFLHSIDSVSLPPLLLLRLNQTVNQHPRLRSLIQHHHFQGTMLRCHVYCINLIAQPPRFSSLLSKPAVLHLAVVPAPLQAQLINRSPLRVARWDGGEQLANGIETLGQVALDKENVFQVQ